MFWLFFNQTFGWKKGTNTFSTQEGKFPSKQHNAKVKKIRVKIKLLTKVWFILLQWEVKHTRKALKGVTWLQRNGCQGKLTSSTDGVIL